jgi:acyl dehydratase
MADDKAGAETTAKTGFNVDKEFEAATQARIEEGDIEKARSLDGVFTANKKEDIITRLTPDAIRNFAHGVGDDNPLFCDPAYGAKTRWGRQIAPNSMAEVVTKGLRGDSLPDHLKAAQRGLFKGIHAFVSGSEKIWYHPLYVEDELYKFGGFDGVEVKPSEFAGRSVTRFLKVIKMNQRSEPVFVQRTREIFTERSTAKKAGKYASIEPATYSAEDMERIDAAYAAEHRRGAEPRYFEDVNIGDALSPMVKGPLTVTDILVYHVGGYGVSTFGLSSGRRAYENRKRIPAFYVRNAQGIPDVAQRVHWDSEWAKAIGNPMPYDYSVIREGWLHHYLTDWVGDDGFVHRQYDEMRKFNYMGDTQFITGQVAGKRDEGGRHFVDLTVKMTNQRGDVTTTCEATVLLPTKAHGPVLLPEPPAELARQCISFQRRHGELLAGRG